MDRTRGLVNGGKSRPRTSGLVNGNGLVNGGALTGASGKVNGMGLVNGVGYTNGHRGLTLKKNRFGVVFQRDIRVGLSIVVFFLLIFPAVVVIMETEEYVPPIMIDSRFEDWDGVPLFGDAQVVYNDNVNIWKYSTVVDGGNIYFYIEVAAKVFDDSNGVDGFYIFIDEDRSSSSGYRVRDIGADFMIEVVGGDREVFESRFSVFRGAEYNWSAWESEGGVNVGVSESRMEVSVFSMDIGGDFDALIYATDFEGSECFTSVKFGPKLTALVITQSSVGELLGFGTAPFLRLDFSAVGGEITIPVGGLIVQGVGNISILSLTFLPLTMERGRTYTEYVHVDTSSATLEDFGELELLGVLAFDEDDEVVPVTIRGESAKAYVGGRPVGKRIDGLFRDWTNKSYDGVDADLVNKKIDITEYSADKDDSYSYFYLKTEGTMLGGTTVPSPKSRAGEPGGPGGPPSGVVVIPREATGQDITRIFIDANSSDWFGYYRGGNRYDYVIEIRGIFGKVIPHLSVLRKWDGERFNDWSTIEARNNAHQLECSASLVSLSPLNESNILFVTTDWSGEMDTIGEPTDWHTRSGTRSVILVEDTSSSSSSTAYSSQRKLFHDGSYYWSFYYNDTLGNISYEYSADGSTWDDDPGNITIEGATYASIWYNSSNSNVYVVSDNSTSTKNVTVVNGTIDGANINWSTPQVVEVSGLDEDHKIAYITVNSSGYVWIAATTHSSTTGYNINVTYTDNPGDISSWGTPQTMRSSDVSNEYVYPVVLPFNDTDMYVVWYADGYIEGREYNASGWGSVDSIDVTGSGASNKGPSAVADNGNIHLVYINSSGYANYSKYTGSWTSSNLDSSDTGRSPTITLETSSPGLYALWIDSTEQIVGKYSTTGGSSWSTMTGITTNTTAKGNLTSIYSCDLNDIAWEFDESPRIAFEPIPEFTDVIIPIVSIMVLVAFRRRRRDHAVEAAEET
jgi:hypothetical protein